MKRIGMTLTLTALAATAFVAWQQVSGQTGSQAQPPAGQPQTAQIQLDQLDAPNPEDIELDMNTVSYAIGMNMGKDIKSSLVEQDELDADEVLKGFNDVLDGNVDESYATGVSIGMSMQRDMMNNPMDLDFDVKQLQAGMNDGMNDADPKIDDQKMQQAMGAFQQKMFALQMQQMQKQQQAQQQMQQQQQAQQADREATAIANAKKAEAFLKDNAKKAGVKTTDSGLQYKVLKQGEGTSPKPTDVVTVHYKGMLEDGSVFDSSYQRGEPITFEVDKLIPAWSEALPMMKTGGKWKLFVPPDLGYGLEGAPPRIPANALLIFEVELLGIEQDAG